MNRVFNSLTVRTIDDDQRVIEGVATTNRKDRVSDIVESLGAEFDLPIPLLLDHSHSDAVGEVEAAEVTSTGIRFRARIKKIAEPGLAKDLVDKAWHLVKYGLRKTCSIGFQPLEYEPLPDGGLRFTKWSWYELSLVSVPANQDAVIESVKRAPRGRRGAERTPKGHVLRLTNVEILRGKWEVEHDRRRAARKRLGIPNPVIRLTAAELVDARLAMRREERASAKRKRLAGKLSIRR
jgi:HK97 family phage prohead protease